MNEKVIKHKFKHTMHRLSGAQIFALGYLLVILLGSFFLSLPIAAKSREWTPYINALFASTSATCVTGLVPYDTFTHWSGFGQAVILCLIQIGGIGFMTLISLAALFLKRKIGLYERKLLMQSAGSLKIGGVVSLIKRIVIGTFFFETIGTLLLMIVFVPRLGYGMGLWNSIFHSVSAFCNAGIDLMGRYSAFSSFTTMQDNILLNFTLMFLILIGGLGFIVWSDIWDCKANPKKFQLHTKIALIATAVLIIVPTALFLLFERNNLFKDMSFGQSLMCALFQSVTPRTAGFNTINLASLSESSSLLTMILMFIGGNSGSTAGGIKITTFVVLLFNTFATARKNGEIVVFKRRLDSHVVKQASAILVAYLAFVMFGTMFICALESFSLKEVMFEVVSAIGTVGLSMGITPSLCVGSKLILCLLMFVGRLGAMSFAIAFAEKINATSLSRPVGHIMIG